MFWNSKCDGHIPESHSLNHKFGFKIAGIWMEEANIDTSKGFGTWLTLEVSSTVRSAWTLALILPILKWSMNCSHLFYIV